MFTRSLLKHQRVGFNMFSLNKKQSTPIFNRNNLGRAAFSTKNPEIDYYNILGLDHKATQDEIKQAYRNLAKIYHPDVNTTGETHQPNAEKFRQIAEAYAVLSIPENKMSYDQTRLRKSDAVFSSVKSETMEKNRQKRDAAGRVPSAKPTRGSYAEYRLKKLAKEREKFNVNHLGNYRGGLPQKDNFNVRKGSLDAPGKFHDVSMINYIERFERDSYEVTSKIADEHNRSREEEEYARHRPRPYYQLEEDSNWEYVRKRTYAAFVIFSIFAFVIGKRVYTRETGRIMRNDRQPDVLIDKPAHHFVNKGGVLLKKQFDGFRTTFKNDKELTDWYTKVYPNIMKGAE